MVGARLHGALTVLVGVVALALAAAPAVVAFGLGWMTLGWSQEAGDIGHVVDDNPIEAWVLLALAFLVWVPLVVVALVAVLDRLGRHYTPLERESRPREREARRRRAGLRFLAGREAAGARARPPSAAKKGRASARPSAPPGRPSPEGATAPPTRGQTPPTRGQTPPTRGQTPPTRGQTPPTRGQTPPQARGGGDG